MNNITYHFATVNDIDLLIQSRIDFLEDYWGKQGNNEVDKLRPELFNYFSAMVPSGEYISVIAKHAGNLVGVGGVVLRSQPGSFKNPGGKIGHVMNMYTIPEFRRQGISSKILTMLLDEANKKGYKLFDLNATKSGEPVYIKNGFYKHPEPTYRRFLD